MSNNRVRIFSEGFTVPTAVQSELRAIFATRATKDVTVKKDGENYDIYTNKYMFSMNVNGVIL